MAKPNARAAENWSFFVPVLLHVTFHYSHTPAIHPHTEDDMNHRIFARAPFRLGCSISRPNLEHNQRWNNHAAFPNIASSFIKRMNITGTIRVKGFHYGHSSSTALAVSLSSLMVLRCAAFKQHYNARHPSPNATVRLLKNTVVPHWVRR